MPRVGGHRDRDERARMSRIPTDYRIGLCWLRRRNWRIDAPRRVNVQLRRRLCRGKMNRCINSADIDRRLVRCCPGPLSQRGNAARRYERDAAIYRRYSERVGQRRGLITVTGRDQDRGEDPEGDPRHCGLSNRVTRPLGSTLPIGRTIFSQARAGVEPGSRFPLKPATGTLYWSRGA